MIVGALTVIGIGFTLLLSIGILGFLLGED